MTLELLEAPTELEDELDVELELKASTVNTPVRVTSEEPPTVVNVYVYTPTGAVTAPENVTVFAVASTTAEMPAGTPCTDTLVALIQEK